MQNPKQRRMRICTNDSCQKNKTHESSKHFTKKHKGCSFELVVPKSEAKSGAERIVTYRTNMMTVDEDNS